jgi:hypothetical protein
LDGIHSICRGEGFWLHVTALYRVWLVFGFEKFSGILKSTRCFLSWKGSGLAAVARAVLLVKVCKKKSEFEKTRLMG